MVTAAAKKRRTKPVEPEVVEEEEEVDEVEELEEDEVEDEPNKRSASAKNRAKAAVTFGMAHLAEYLSEQTGKVITTRELRQLARKMARDGQGRVDREIVAGNRTRYDWPSIDDPEVQAIIAAYNGGELEADKKEKLDALKASKAAKVAAKKAAEEDDSEEEAPAPKRKAPVKKAPVKRTVVKKAAPPVVEDDDEDLEMDDDE